MQLKADGQIKDLSEGRAISLASSDIKKYDPQDSRLWENAYDKYLSFLKIK